jgi:imidazolonepropionase-like amidohydrolase
VIHHGNPAAFNAGTLVQDAGAFVQDNQIRAIGRKAKMVQIVAHAQGTEGIKNAVRAGTLFIEPGQNVAWRKR